MKDIRSSRPNLCWFVGWNYYRTAIISYDAQDSTVTSNNDKAMAIPRFRFQEWWYMYSKIQTCRYPF